MKQKHIVALTGAGISAESGLKTFRDHDGLWMGHRVEDVATPGAFMRDPALVLDFYNQRRRDVANSFPNAAHFALASLEENYKVTIITQNIDDLHERGGSTNIIHLHGEIFKMHSLASPDEVLEIRGDILPGDKGKDGTQLRPHIVWFEEAVPKIETAVMILQEADIFIIVGTSLQVYPAASLLHYAPAHAKKYIIDKKVPLIPAGINITVIEEPATTGIDELGRQLALIYAV